MKIRSWKPAVASIKGFVADSRKGQNRGWCKKPALKTRCVWAAFWEVSRSNAETLRSVWGISLLQNSTLHWFSLLGCFVGLREATL